MFQCLDAPIVLGAPNERLWAKVCEALGHAEWLADPRFKGNAQRNRHRSELVPLMEAVLRQDDAAAWIDRLESFDVPCGPVSTLSQALAQPQVSARGAVVEAEHDRLGKIRLVANPMRMDDYAPSYRAPAALGADTVRIQAEFGEPTTT